MLRLVQVTTLAAPLLVGATPTLAAEAYVPQATATVRSSDIPSRPSESPLLATPISLASAQAAAASMSAGNVAQVVQIGSYNSGTVSQTGAGNVAALYQQGQGNFALISQSGRGR